MKWRILDTGRASAQENMELDRKLLEELDLPTLHFYDWNQNSITFGHFIEPANYLNLQHSEKWNLDLARRPTGGGITFHLTDLAFSVLVPSDCEGYHVNVMDNYAFVNTRVSQAIERLIGKKTDLLPVEPSLKDGEHFCMAKATKYDVMWNGKKVGGGAQRRTKAGFLHQGTLFLVKPSDAFLRDLVTPEICTCIQQSSEFLFSDSSRLLELRNLFKSELIRSFQKNGILFQRNLV